LKKKLSKIVISGGNGRFARVLKKTIVTKNYFFPDKKKLNILNLKSVEKYLKTIKPKYFIHAAGLSRPMQVHNKKISKSIDLNIIGTCNVVKVCEKLNIKLIYFSTGYVYPGVDGNYNEEAPVKPINNYAISKLGGECAVRMYKNSLILRIIMCEKPFLHKSAFYDIKTNFIFHDDVAIQIPKLLNKKGIVNIGGKTQSVYNFAKKYKKKIKKTSGKKLFPPNPSMDISKFLKIIKKNKNY
tara:strand:- start:46 stop:768 length:723 start_codon:yes stop_codon:yes gene_type:complete